MLNFQNKIGDWFITLSMVMALQLAQVLRLGKIERVKWGIQLVFLAVGFFQDVL